MAKLFSCAASGYFGHHHDEQPELRSGAPAEWNVRVQIGYLVAAGSDTSFSRLEVLVDSELRAYMGGFFELTAYLANPMIPGGLMVTCGRPNASGKPDYGKAYS